MDGSGAGSRRAWPDGVRRAAVGLWLAGAGLAGFTATLSVAHRKLGFAAVYAVVATALAGLAVATHRNIRAAQVVTLVGLGSQGIGAIGAAWELVYGGDDNAKARHLRDLGVNYRLALALNLAFSLIASAAFVWAATVLRRQARHRR